MISPAPAVPQLRKSCRLDLAVVEPDTAHLARRFKNAFLSLRRAEALLVIAQADGLAELDARGRSLGFASFAVLAREALGMSSRTARYRLALREVFRRFFDVRERFLRGEITACQILTIRPVLTKDTEDHWIRKCRFLTVTQLKAAVKAAMKKAADPADAAEDEPNESVEFKAPPEAVLAWEQAMDTARRVLGADVSDGACVDAVLAEASAGLPPAAKGSNGAAAVAARLRCRRFRLPEPIGTPDVNERAYVSPEAARRAEPLFREVHDLVARLESPVDTPGGQTAAEILCRVRELGAVEPAIRLLTGRLLAELQSSNVLGYLGYQDLDDFASRFLRVSPRTMRTLLSEARMFRGDPELTGAYAAGRIGAGQAGLVDRVANGRTRPHIERAVSVTHRQFSREVRFLEKLGRFEPDLHRDHSGPLPSPGLEPALRERLRERGCGAVDVRRVLKDYRIPDRARSSRDPLDSDPAANPMLMRRLELLLDLLILTRVAGQDREEARQTFAPNGSMVIPDWAHTIRFRAPESVVAMWREAVETVRNERGRLPTWACAMLIVREAVNAWNQREPVGNETILQRDRFICQVPGCTSRRGLEVHHIVFRSRGGGNDRANRVTLCAEHHRIGIHEGRIRLTGQAPDRLTWELGGMWRLRGDRYVSRRT